MRKFHYDFGTEEAYQKFRAFAMRHGFTVTGMIRFLTTKAQREDPKTIAQLAETTETDICPSCDGHGNRQIDGRGPFTTCSNCRGSGYI